MSRPSASLAIEARGLGKSFAGEPAVADLDLEIRRGEIFAFLGPNGSGKTTTMRMLTGLLTPDAGEGRCLGLDIRTQADRLRRHIGYVPQHFSLYEDLTVLENLRFVAQVYGLGNDGPDAIERICRRFGLSPFARRLAGTLSGGWKQRLALACALLPEPELLILDEPTSGVDPEARSFFWKVMNEEAARGATAMISTHYLDEAEQYCDRLGYILNGRLIALGTADEVIEASGLVAIRLPGAPVSVVSEAEAERDVLYAVRTAAEVILAGTDEAALRSAAGRLAPAIEPEPVKPRLEEVFLHLARRRT